MPPAKIREVGTDGIAFEIATPASQPGDVFPSGVIMSYAGSSAPTNWLIADGSAVSRTTYAALFAAISTTFGVGDGSTTFNLPDLRDKVPVGKSASKALGSTGGEATHLLTNSEMPAHSHTGHTTLDGDHNHTGNTTMNGGHSHTAGVSVSTGSSSTFAEGSGTGSGHNGTTNAVGDHNHTIVASGTHNHTIVSDGGDVAHNNMPPYVSLNYIIKT